MCCRNEKCFVPADAVLGRSNPFARIYSPARKLRGLPFVPVLHPMYLWNTLQVSTLVP